jgi:hypothetical protein
MLDTSIAQRKLLWLLRARQAITIAITADETPGHDEQSNR